MGLTENANSKTLRSTHTHTHTHTQESKTQSLEFEIQDYICSHAKFPLVATTSSPSSSSSDHIHSALAAAFEGHDRISKLAQTFQQEIIYKLAPSLDDKSASPPLSTASSSTSSSNQQRDQGQVPRPPFFQPQQPPSSLIDPSFQPGYGNPYAIGDRDLDPFAAAPGIAGPR